ncbi:MAG: CBU_0592 family membrane protein [Solirubrobacteraceae bacterium]
MLVIVQVLGALLILAPFAAHQFGRLGSDAPVYLWPNLIGSAALAVLAGITGQWGFLLLEGAWAAVTARSIINGRVPTPR